MHVLHYSHSFVLRHDILVIRNCVSAGFVKERSPLLECG